MTRTMLFAVPLLICTASPAAAQVGSACRDSIVGTGVGLALAPAGTNVDPPFDVDVLQHRAVTGLGPGVSLYAARGVGSTWALRGSFDYARFRVIRTDLDGHNRTRIGTIGDQRFGMVGVKAAAGRGTRACALWMVGLNVHRLRDPDHIGTMVGATVGLETSWRWGDRRRLLLNFALDASHARGEQPFGVVIFVTRFLIGLERRF